MRTRLATLTTVAVVALTLVALPTQAQGKSQFQVRCLSSHVAQVDPIVAPGPSGTMSAHMHEFFGNRSTDSNSDLASMRAANTTCSTSDDTAGYWTPTLIKNGMVVRAQSMLVYYRGSFAGQHVQPFPADLMMVSHDGSVGVRNNVTLRVTFPSCWDGVRLDSADHISHMAYPRNGCPASHPVPVPRITEIFRYPTSVVGARLSSGDFSTLHADFWNTWRQPGLAALVDRCLNGGIDCGRIDA